MSNMTIAPATISVVCILAPVFAVELSHDRSKTITEVHVGYVKVDAHFPSHLVAEELAFTLEKFQSGPRAAI